MILEQFKGFVDQIRDDIAFVTLQSGDEKWFGEYDAKELLEMGIRERRRFKCAIVEVDDEVNIVFEPIPDLEVDEEEVARQIDILFKGGSLEGE